MSGLEIIGAVLLVSMLVVIGGGLYAHTAHELGALWLAIELCFLAPAPGRDVF
jgi:hypothetical protein